MEQPILKRHIWSLKIEQLKIKKTLKSEVLVKHIEKKLKSKKKLE